MPLVALESMFLKTHALAEQGGTRNGASYLAVGSKLATNVPSRFIRKKATTTTTAAGRAAGYRLQRFEKPGIHLAGSSLTRCEIPLAYTLPNLLPCPVPMVRHLIAVLALLSVSAFAQSLPSDSLEKGAWELGLWTAGGHSVSGGTADTGVWNGGVRIGKVLSGEHGSGFLQGNLEYVVDFIPVYLLVFPRQTSYAGGFDPFILKWNFTSARKVAPYLEFGGGVLLSIDDVPPGTNNVNFMPQASFGVQIFTREKRAVSVTAKYVHISNAGLATPNPGINTIQASVGYHWFK